MTEEQLRAELAALHASKSWRLTAPLRLAMSVLYGFRAFVRNPRPLVGATLRHAAKYRAIRQHGGSMLRGFPGLHQRVKRIALLAPPALPLPPAQLSTPAHARSAPQAAAEALVIVCDAVTPAMHTSLAAPATLPIAQPEAEATLGRGARGVLAELRAARRRFH